MVQHLIFAVIFRGFDEKTDSYITHLFYGRKLILKHSPRFRLMPLTYRHGYILRSEFVMSERDMGTAKSGENVKLELGEHQIAKELKDLNLGKIVNYGYCPQAQGILTPVFESYAG